MDEKTKEQRYEDLVNAVAGGELKMVKFLWNIVDSIDSLIRKTPQGEMRKLRKEVDAELKKLRDNPPKDGKTPTNDELKAIIQPLIPAPIPGKPGKDGYSPSTGFLMELIADLIPDPIPGTPGGPGKAGKTGRIPKHEWRGTFIRFENPDGSWGEWVNIQGAPSEPMEYTPGGSMPLINVRTASGQRFQGVNEIVFADNLTVTKTNNGVSVSGEDGGSGGGGGNINFETPTGTIDDSNDTFTVANEPLYIVVNGAQMFEGGGYSYLAGTITLDNPIGTGGFIRSAYGSGISVETPTGTVDDSNVTFTVANTPLYLVVNGAQIFEDAGYSIAGGTITLDYAVGTGGVIRSIY